MEFRFKILSGGFLLLQLIFGLSSCAQVEKQNQQVPLQQYFDQWLSQSNLVSASIGVLVKNEAGEVVLEYNSNQSLVPASTQKLLTTAFALEQLGPRFQFETKIWHTGRIDASGLLNGDLWIQGGGDPTLGSDRFGGLEKLKQIWVSEIQKAGIKSISGSVKVDASVFPKYSTPRTWIWEDLGNYYGAVPSGLSFHDNTYKMLLNSPYEVGQVCGVVRTEPKMKHLIFDSQVTASNDRADNAYIYGAEGSTLRYIKGTIPKGRKEFSIKGSISNPELVAERWLVEVLTQKGIPVVGNTFNDDQKQLLYTHKSPYLAEIVTLTNKYSINLYAEHLAIWLNENRGEKLTVELGAQSVKEGIRKMGIDTKGMFLVDGSGLSRFNAVSANHLVEVLNYMTKSENASVFIKSLSVAGESGTLNRMFAGSPVKGKIKAKSGYMERVRSYAGYIETLQGEKLTFCILVNNYEGSASETKHQIKKLLEHLAVGG
ncbi:MAG: D-alanyl-D-alanine carboxypeptidase/D-alanyl-D-alanine-endopeptidase [Salibacteraceae bacterium]|nr:D-alanyl-D-alanine carboxypeptidase/D-alanyl-D-alanine-endopeptidase [Salibacteraceae bacterium]|tara:strand:- start:11005 stop:12462 length:1458 start_codon:yes stop_codon:yes gene_type:complete